MSRFALVRVVLVVGAVSTVSLAAPTLLPMPPSGASEPSGALEALSGREELSGASTMRQPQVDLTPAVPSHGQGLDVREPLAIADVFVDPVTGTDDLSYTDNTWSSGDVDVDAREHDHIQDAVADVPYEHVNLKLGRRTEVEEKSALEQTKMTLSHCEAEKAFIQGRLEQKKLDVMTKGRYEARVKALDDMISMLSGRNPPEADGKSRS
ncbi:hypothetical protein F5880DRAFT_572812 [Lentinula raphanica]|nr:hypothetical protein F5880DRAFT_572812 [Lentinula raphanica]